MHAHRPRVFCRLALVRELFFHLFLLVHWNFHCGGHDCGGAGVGGGGRAGTALLGMHENQKQKACAGAEVDGCGASSTDAAAPINFAKVWFNECKVDLRGKKNSLSSQGWWRHGARVHVRRLVRHPSPHLEPHCMCTDSLRGAGAPVSHQATTVPFQSRLKISPLRTVR